MPRPRLKDPLHVISELNGNDSDSCFKKTVLKLIGEYDLEFFVLAMLPNSHFQIEEAIQDCAWPRGWLEHYAQAGFSRIDPVVIHCRSSCLPVRWKDLAADRNRVMAEAKEYGMRDGFSLPMYGPDGFAACLSMSGRKPRLQQEAMHLLHLVATHAGERMRARVVTKTSLANPLTEREREVLTWAAAGKSAEEIADLLAIKKRTVTAHIVNAMDKLGAANKVQAVACAIRNRLIEP